MFRKLRENIGYYFLGKKAARIRRETAFINLKQAKSVAVIANMDNMEKYKVLSRFVEELQKEGKRVFVLALVENEEFQKFFAKGTSILVFSKKNTTWYGKPRNIRYEDFIDEPFDILIDTSLKQIITIQYLVALSKARFKVGRFAEQRSYYDFMINLKADDSLSFFITQIKHYLMTINR